MPKKIVLNNNGLTSLLQRRLDSKVRRIELERQQFDSQHVHSCRKVITRFARKLMLTNLHSNFGNQQGYSNEKEESKYNDSFVLPQIHLPSNSSRLEGSTQYTSRTSNRPLSELENGRLFHTETPYKPRDNTNYFDREISNISYDNETHGENVLMPRNLVARRNTNKAFESTNLPEIFKYQKKISQKNWRRFMNSLDNDDSGFYFVTNAKGVPMCDGYDNYGALLKSTQNIPLQGGQTQNKQNVNKNKSFKDPFTRDTPFPSLFAKKSEDDFSECADSERDFDEIHKEDYRKPIQTPNKRRSNLVPCSANLFKEILQCRKKEEEDKIVNDTFKAQNIRSLTMRPLDIY